MEDKNDIQDQLPQRNANPYDNSRRIPYKSAAPQSPAGDGHVVSGVQVWECFSRESVPADVDRLHKHINANTYLRDGECFLRGTLIAKRHPDSVRRRAAEIMKREQSTGTYLVLELQTWDDIDVDPRNLHS